MIYLGVDPGAKGSLCFLDMDTRKMGFKPTPCLEFTAKQLRVHILAIHKKYDIRMAAIEDVHAIFGTSAGSNFKFGYNVGIINGVIQTTNIGLDLVTPRTWQRAIKAPTRKRAGGATKLKKAIAAIALRLYPDAPLLGPRGGLLDGRADALMIAHYLSLKYGGKL
jgi:hypothetical protein